MQISEVRVLDVRMLLFQVVSEFYRDIRPIVTFGAVVHLDSFMFPSMQNVFADIFSTV
jgi:hypothetical protein